MITSTVERQGTAYRQGLVLGFTMAEALLLLVFCLLIATGASLTHERRRSNLAENRKLEAERSLADSRAALDDLNTNNRLGELLAKRGEKMSAPAIEDLWTRLTSSLESVEALEREGSSIDALRLAEEQSRKAASQASEEKMAYSALQDALKSAGMANFPPTDIIALLQDGQTARHTKEETRKSPGIHDWPPIINLSEAGGYYFAKGSAELTPKFSQELRDIVIPRLKNIIDRYQVDLIEVVGHTDEQQIAARTSNLDKEMLNVVRGGAPLNMLRPADNAGLGIARAVAITRVLSGDTRLSSLRVLPMSGAQLIDTTERLASGTNQGDVQERRRIEIRVRKAVK